MKKNTALILRTGNTTVPCTNFNNLHIKRTGMKHTMNKILLERFISLLILVISSALLLSSCLFSPDFWRDPPRFFFGDEYKYIVPYEGARAIKSNQTIIKKREFYDYGLTMVIIPEGVTTIEKEAFAQNKLFRVIIPESCIEIAPDAFDKNVQLVYMKDKHGEHIGDYKIISNENGVIITNYIGRVMDVVIPNEINGQPVTEIGERAFAGKCLTSAVIPNTVTVINTAAFEYNLLEEIIILGKVTKLPNIVFYQNRLIKVTLPNGLKEIGREVFRDNPLRTVTIPDSVETIGENAFSRYVKLVGNKKFENCRLTFPGILHTYRNGHPYNNEMTVKVFDGQNVNYSNTTFCVKPGIHTIVFDIATAYGSAKDVQFSFEIYSGGDFRLVFFNNDNTSRPYTVVMVQDLSAGGDWDILYTRGYPSYKIEKIINWVR